MNDRFTFRYVQNGKVYNVEAIGFAPHDRYIDITDN